MNIFVTNIDPTVCAENLDNKRMVKMCLESTQMLCTAINEYGGSTPYKSTHKNHPCNIWARTTLGNWMWLYQHALSLCIEYSKRFNKKHKCFDVLESLWTENDPTILLPSGRLEPFVNCAAHQGKGLNFKTVNPVYKAYQKYLVARWATDTRKPKWTNRNPPKWRTENPKL